MNLPIRIQRLRTTGFNLQAQSPDGRPVVSVCRPGKFGNPFYVGDGYGTQSIEEAVKKHRNFVFGQLLIDTEYLSPLRGKHLACFCPIGQPCHADTLLELANDQEQPEDHENKEDIADQLWAAQATEYDPS